MNPVDDYILAREGNQRDIMLHLHQLLLSFPGITARLSYGIPFYYRHHWLCYLNPLKGDRVELCFIRGKELSGNSAILEMRKRKTIAGIQLHNLIQLPEEEIVRVIHEALILDMP